MSNCECPVKNNVNSVQNQFCSKLKNIHGEDLKYVEKDLALYEKVSLVFLLFGHKKVSAQYALQRLLILVNNQNDELDILCEYKKIEPNWKKALLEALSIIKAKKVIRKLGFDVSELYAVFLPHIPEISSHIHPMLKALYIMCEKLTDAEAGRLVLDINGQSNFSNHIRFYDLSLLEVFLLDWITKDVITIGNWPSDMSVLPKVDNILQFLKENGQDAIKEMLLSAIRNASKRINYTTESSSRRGNLNENDSGTSKNENFEKRLNSDSGNEERYLIRKEWAGFILIINQKDFHRETNTALKDQLLEMPLKSRRGTDVDKAALRTVFSSFGYIPIEIDGCSHLDMLNIINDTVKRSIVYDSLIVCILSHGIEGAVFGNNSIPVQISNVNKIMASNSLLGKPKMLIIQACQGAEYQKALKVEYLEHDAPESSVPAFCDMLTAVASVPGFASVRNIESGSWFIQTLCKLVNELGDRKHMMDILTAVNKQVTAKRGGDNQCMVPQSSQTLNKSFFLPNRI